MLIRMAGAITSSTILVVAEKLPETPVILTVVTPDDAELDGQSVRRLFPVSLSWLQIADTPDGSGDDTENTTRPLNPALDTTLIAVESA
jgi:hypothetical protein